MSKIKKISLKQLIKLGFEEIDIKDDYADKVYHKRFTDKKDRTKYFLTVKHYTLKHPTTGIDLSGYEVSGQFYLKGSHNAINMTFLDEDILETINFIDKLFELDLLDYYEVYDED